MNWNEMLEQICFILLNSWQLKTSSSSSNIHGRGFPCPHTARPTPTRARRRCYAHNRSSGLRHVVVSSTRTQTHKSTFEFFSPHQKPPRSAASQRSITLSCMHALHACSTLLLVPHPSYKRSTTPIPTPTPIITPLHTPLPPAHLPLIPPILLRRLPVQRARHGRHRHRHGLRGLETGIAQDVGEGGHVGEVAWVVGCEGGLRRWWWWCCLVGGGWVVRGWVVAKVVVVVVGGVGW